ncbi:MAG: NUDIX domain-containing protein [Chloroflexota bacterium]
MSIPYEQSYLGRMRKLIGKQEMFAIGARAVIQNDQGKVLFVQRSDNHLWVMPAGSIELGESIYDCVVREVKEETGLDVESAYPISLYSAPKYSFVTSYGDPYQMFSLVFIVDKWSGELFSQTDETIAAQFFDIDNLPENIPHHYHETLDDVKQFNGRLILK